MIAILFIEANFAALQRLASDFPFGDVMFGKKGIGERLDIVLMLCLNEKVRDYSVVLKKGVGERRNISKAVAHVE